MTFWGLFEDFLSNFLQLSEGFLRTYIKNCWGLSMNFLKTFLGLLISKDLLRTVWGFSNDSWMNFSRLCRGFLKTFWWFYKEFLRTFCKLSYVFNRPGVAGAVLQSPSWFIIWLIHWATDPLIKIFSNYSQSQTGRARELKCWENVRPTLCVMCNASRVLCHVSPVTCHMSCVICHIFFYSFFCYKKNNNSIL